MEYQEQMDLDRFSYYLWNNLISVADVSLEFREKNEKFLDEITYFYFTECLRSNMSEEVASRLIKKTLSSIDSNKVDFSILY